VQQEDWSAATATGKLLMAIDPLRPVQLRRLVTVAMKTEEVDLAVRCLQGLLELDPTSAADSHFQIARLVASTNPVDARRHVLLALEQAPRFREAHRLLLGLTPVQTQEPLPSANDPEADAARN
jgi:predicted TPR repeat methyltransferase